MASEQQLEIWRTIARFPPQNAALGIRFVAWHDGRITLALPYDEKLVGNPATGVLHGGAITTVLDAACGLAVIAKLEGRMAAATLDLRIDYLKPAVPGREVHARAECFKLTRSIAFVRCDAFHEGSEADIIAVANGTFMLLAHSPGRDAT